MRPGVSQQHVRLMQPQREDFCCNYWFHIPAGADSFPERAANDTDIRGGGWLRGRPGVTVHLYCMCVFIWIYIVRTFW